MNYKVQIYGFDIGLDTLDALQCRKMSTFISTITLSPHMTSLILKNNHPINK